MTQHTLDDIGWCNHFRQQLSGVSDAGQVPARVIAVQRSGWTVVGEFGEARLRPSIPGDERPVTVGDWLLLDKNKDRAVSRFERKSLFKRRAPGTDRSEQLIAANVDTLLIVSSCNQDFNEARTERYLAIAHEARVMPLLILTKADLVDDPQQFVARAARLSPGLLVEAVNALDPATLDCLAPWLAPGQTLALLGSSGVGKTTLTNTLLGETTLATQAVREDDDKGRHTTTSRRLYKLPGGGWILDTPGMRELQLVGVQTGIDDVFAEIADLASGCRFADCTHETEPGCAILAAVEAGRVDAGRLKRWRKLLREEALNRETVAEKRARGKAMGRLYKSVISDSHKNKGRS